jgi:cytochrome c553
VSRTLALAGIVLAALLAAAPATGAERRGDPKRGFAISESCAACHEGDGRSRGYRLFPRIAGQHYDYLVTAISEFRSKERRQTMALHMMWDATADLTDQDVRDLAAFYSGLPW